MTLNGRNVTLSEIIYSYGARHKNSMLSTAKCRPMILVASWKYKIYADIRGDSIGEGASSTISANFEHEFCGRSVWGVYTRHMSLRAASHTVIGYVKINIRRSFDQNALNAICLNSSRIKSA